MPEAITRLVLPGSGIANGCGADDGRGSGSREEIDCRPAGYAVASEEGISNDELAKIRLWHLQTQSATILRQTLMADAKAATVLALIGLVATKVLMGLDLSAAGSFTILMFTNKAVVLCLCLYVIIPRFPREEDWTCLRRFERFSWAALSNPQLGSYDYGQFAAQADASQIFRSVGRANQGAARVLMAKFRLLRVVFLLAIADVLLTMIYLAGT